MNHIIEPGDYICWYKNGEPLYGTVLEVPHERQSRRIKRGIQNEAYLVRCDHIYTFEWAGYANHYADKFHFDVVPDSSIIELVQSRQEHDFTIGDRVYSREFSSIGILRARHLGSALKDDYCVVEFDWNLNQENWFDLIFCLHTCNGALSSNRGLFCQKQELIWIPEYPCGTVNAQAANALLENPFHVIFKKTAAVRKASHG